MRVGGSKPPSKSGMSWLKQKEQQGGWSDMWTPRSEAYQDHPREWSNAPFAGVGLNF